jgi:adenylate cyclase
MNKETLMQDSLPQSNTSLPIAIESVNRPTDSARVVTRALVNQVADWLMAQALADTDVNTIVMGCCERLRAVGIPIVRGFVSFSTLHPLYRATSITWERGRGSRTADYAHSTEPDTLEYRHSPFYHMRLHGLETMRVCLECNQRQFDFPILGELQAQGMTDYLAFSVGFGVDKREGMAGSWATDHVGGFSEADIEALLRIQQRLAVATKMAIKGQLMKNIATTYLGVSAGQHVLDGQIKRGDGQSIRAAIWYADLRRSTVLGDQLPRQEYIDTLNVFFDVTGGAVTEKGGDILAFIGDAILAIFPADGDEQSVSEACHRAADAASASRAMMAAVNVDRVSRSKEPLEFGVGLHLGEVMYGNVGVPARLTFSAFGAAVNEVARLDGLTKELGEPILASDRFVKALGERWRSMGRRELRGVGRKMKIFAPAVSQLRPRDPAAAAAPDGSTGSRVAGN